MEEIDPTRGHLVAAAMGPEGDLVASRFARGCRCFGAFIDGALAGYGWLSTGPEWIGELELEINPRPGEGYVWNCATVPEYRRRGVFRSLLLGISAAGRADGLKRLWIGSVAIPAERAVGPSGFKPALHFNTRSFGPFASTWVSQSAAAEPRLILDARRSLGLRENPSWLGLLIRRKRPRSH